MINRPTLHVYRLMCCIIIWTLNSVAVVAQNLVPNPSFEIFTTCPLTLGIGGPLQATPWVGINTADYHNACGGFNTGVPINAFGYQDARTGVAYAGIFHKINGGMPEQREYLQAPLLEALQPGVCYEVGYWINLADIGCGVNQTGALFTQGPEPNPFEMTPQLDAGGPFYTDKVNWQYISGYVLAVGGEDYITIGNFYNDADTDFDPPCDDFVVSAYYFIEDVLVEISAIQEINVELGSPVTSCDSFVIDPGNPQYSYVWSDGSTGPTLTVSATGTYSVTASYACFTAEDEIEVTILEEVSVDIGPPSIDLCAGDQIDISLDPNEEIYTWQDGTQSPDYTITSGGTYQVTLDNGCYSATDAITINLIDVPDPFSLGEDTFFCPGESILFDLDPSLGNFLWQDGTAGPTYIITDEGNYALTISNACGEESATIDVSLLEPPAVDLGPDTIVLCDGDFVEYNLDPYLTEYQWDDGSSGPDYIISNPGFYGVTATNACGVDTDFVTVMVGTAPVVSLGPDTTFCEGDTLVLSPLAQNGNFIWQDSSTANTLLVITQGLYAVTVTNACGADEDTIAINTFAPLASPDLGPDTSLCSNQTLILQTNTPGATFLWNDLSTADTLVVSTSGQYYVEVSNVCLSLSDTIQVDLFDNGPIVQLPPDFALCAGDTAVLDAGISGVSYLWSDGSALSQLTVSSPGLYSISVSNTCGSGADTILITSGVASPAVQLGMDTSICAGEIFLINPTYANVDSWLWPDGSTGSQYSVTAPGIAYVAVSNSCATAFDTLLVSLSPAVPLLDLGPDTSICPGTSISLSIDVPDVNILWSDGSTASSIILSDSAAIYALITNQCGQSTDTFSVFLLPGIPMIDLGTDQNICPGETFTITPGITDVAYLWNDGSVLPQFEATQDDTISVTISNSCGSSSDTLILTESTEGPLVDLGPDIVACSGETVIIEAGILGVMYSWQDGSTQDQLVTTQSGTYSLMVSNACGSDQDTIQVLFEALPIAQNLGSDTTLCEGEILRLTASGGTGSQFVWQDQSIADTVVVTSPGIYSIISSNRCGELSDSINISYINSPLPFSLGPDTTLCQNESILLSAPSDTFDLVWQDGSTVADLLVDQQGTYILQLSNQCGAVSDSINISINPDSIVPGLLPQLSWCPGDILTLDVTQPFLANYIWNTGSADPLIEISEAGIYSVVITTACSQASAQTLVITPEDCFTSPAFSIPNVFSPDGNGVNDFFTVSTNLPENVIAMEGTMYDRWGNILYTSRAIPFTWDGMADGKPMNPGVHVYLIRVTYLDGGDQKSRTFAGDVTLMR